MQPDKSWTLFLDRDGVINVEKHNDYVLDYKEFVFYPGVLNSIASFTQIFKKIIIVTNQKCIGKGLISHEGLANIHENMVLDIEAHNGKIDAIFYSPYMSDMHPCRKPNCGMAYEAKIKFPNEIDFEKSIMVGNNLSDMKFGKAVGMHTIFLSTTKAVPTTPDDLALIDAHYSLLSDIKF